MKRSRFGVISLAAGQAAFALMLSSPLSGASVEDKGLTPDEQAALAPLQNVLEAIGRHDRDLAREQLLPGGMATLKRGDRVLQLSFDQFVEHIPSTGAQKLEERIHDPLIRIDDDIAVIWAPYVFLVDGKPDHEGTDVANLVKKDGRWLIAGIADNGRKASNSR